MHKPGGCKHFCCCRWPKKAKNLIFSLQNLIYKCEMIHNKRKIIGNK